LLSRSDLVGHDLETALEPDPGLPLTAGAIMTALPAVISRETSSLEAVTVIDTAGKLVGIVSYLDVLRTLS